MDKLRALEYVAAAAHEGSFSAAARRLDVSTVAVAKLVAALERELGAGLFQRTARGLVPTAAGTRYLDACAPAVEALRAAEDEVRSAATPARGTLVVALQHVVARGCLTAALPRFHALHPEIALDVREVQHASDEGAAAVDVMVVLGWPELKDVVQRPIGAGRFMVVASPAYWALHGIPQHPSELAQHQCLALRGIDGTVMDVWSFQRGEEQVSLAVRGWLTASNSQRDVVLDLALRGEGVVRLLDWANPEELASGALVEALEDWESPEAPPVNLIYRSGMRRVPRARVFIDFVTEVFAGIGAARRRDVAPTGRPPWLRGRYGKASDAARRPGLATRSGG